MSHELRCVCVYVQPCALFSCVSHKLSWILRIGVTNSFLRMPIECCDPQWCTKVLKYDQYVKRDPRTCHTECVRHLCCISSIVRRVFLVLICTHTSIHTHTHTHTRSLSHTHTHSLSLSLFSFSLFLSLSRTHAHTRTHTHTHTHICVGGCGTTVCTSLSQLLHTRNSSQLLHTLLVAQFRKARLGDQHVSTLIHIHIMFTYTYVCERA